MAKKRPSDRYWERRAVERLTTAERQSLPYLREIKKGYNAAARATVQSVKDMYSAYYKKDKTFDMEALNMIAPTGDLKRFRADLKSAGISDRLPKYYEGRLTRLELLNAQIWGEINKASVKEAQLSTKSYKKTLDNGYYRTLYDTAKGLKEGVEFNTLNNRTVNQILNTKFEGKNYSERIWHNSDKVAGQLKEIMTKAVATGQSQQKTVREIRERYGVRNSDAVRLVRTETNYFENKAELEAYKEMGIDEVIYSATLDSRTSEVCRMMDGKKIKLSEAEQGLNIPPLHPNCRSTIRGYIGASYEPKARIARDDEGINYYVDGSLTYNRWRNAIESSKSYKGGDKVAVTFAGTGNIKRARVPTEFRDNGITQYPYYESSLDYIVGNKDVLNNIDNLDSYIMINRNLQMRGGMAGSYTAYTGKIELGGGDTVFDAATLWHEIGHAVDNFNRMEGKWFSVDSDILKKFSATEKNLPIEFKEYIMRKGKEAVKIAKIDMKKVKTKAEATEIYTREIQNQMLSNEAFSGVGSLADIYDAITRGRRYKALEPFGAHGAKHWNRGAGGEIEKEMFADFFQLKMFNKTTELNVLAKSHPRLYNELNKVFKEATNALEKGAK